MTFAKMIYPHWKNLPPVMMCLALSCLIISIPLLIWPALYAILGTGSLSMPQVVSGTPKSGNLETLNEYDQQVIIRFDRPMKSQIQIKGVSIFSLDEKSKLGYSFHWEDTKTLVIAFSREVYEDESILLIANVRDKHWGLMIPIEIEYQ